MPKRRLLRTWLINMEIRSHCQREWWRII
jgi:hypothetical protein